MSEHVYTFRLSIGYPGAEREETFDLVDDLDYEAEDLADPKRVEHVLDQELDEWQWEYIEAWAEKQ